MTWGLPKSSTITLELASHRRQVVHRLWTHLRHLLKLLMGICEVLIMLYL